ncbi:MAG: hypothetical protein E6G39_02290 [Actinobacteria bacterium]|nr:MAG: hypothetical protein E6G39_02290 [Actinomycetota bacterium]
MTNATITETDIKSAVAIDRTVDHLIPLVQRSAARAALLRGKRLEIQMGEDGTVAARFVTARF